jgi:hypothetical protein
MDLEGIKQVIRGLNSATRTDLRSWIDQRYSENDPGGGSLTEDELEVLILVRRRELDSGSTSVDALADCLKITREALLGRIKRLNNRSYGPYLQLNRSSNGKTYYSTFYHRMVRQPSTATMALLFDCNPRLGAANQGQLEKFGTERDIFNVSYCLQYLIDLRYFEPRGNEFGPGRRLNSEKLYLKFLADRWAVKSSADKIEVERCRNEILWRVWELEHTPGPDKSREATHAALVQYASSGSEHPRASELAEHSVNSLIAEGALKERFDLDVAGPLYFLNEREEPNQTVVTWPSTAILLAALADNLLPRQELHSISIEELISYALDKGLTLHGTLDAVSFCERAGYLEVHREGGRTSRLWRTERLLAHVIYIRRLASLYSSNSQQAKAAAL